MRETLHTERLILRQLEARDAEGFSKFCTDIDVAKMTGSIPHPFPLLAAESTYSNVVKRLSGKSDIG